MIFGYCRVSTAEQAADDKTSLVYQEGIIQQYAMHVGADRFGVQIYYDAGVSGSVRMKNRPGGEKLLADVQKGDTVVAAKMDRIFRSAIDALETIEFLKEKGADLVLFDMGLQSVMADGPAKLFFSMMAAFAEFERGRIVERISTGLAQKKKKGGYIGGGRNGGPFGYRIEGRRSTSVLVPCEREYPVLQELLEESKGQFFSYVQFAEKLAKRGFFNRNGNKIKPCHLRDIVERAPLQ